MSTRYFYGRDILEHLWEVIFCKQKQSELAKAKKKDFFKYIDLKEMGYLQ